jgi:hypothetical protein
VILANAMHLWNIPGHKRTSTTRRGSLSWLRWDYLSSFVRPAPIQELRSHGMRKQLVREIARHTQRIARLETAATNMEPRDGAALPPFRAAVSLP